MLSQFIVKNFKSIKNEAILDMTSLPIKEHLHHLISINDNDEHLPISVIYGPNGSGKSNVLEAIDALIYKVIGPIITLNNRQNVPIQSKTPIVPFLFDEHKNKPTEFEIFFTTAMAEYHYTLHTLNDTVTYECLIRKRMNATRKSIVTLFERFENESISLRADLKLLKVSTDITDSLPLLTYLGMTYRKNSVIQDVIDWFYYRIHFLNYGNPIQDLAVSIVEQKEAQILMLKMMQEMNIDIDDFRIEKHDDKTEIFTIHNVNGVTVELPFSAESKGTQKIFSLLPLIARSLRFGTVLIVDELDAKLHPALLKYIIQLYADKDSNRNGAQLIFTSHDLTTMNNQLLRRDEIWFVAKGNDESSMLYSLAEFKTTDGDTPRSDARYDKKYLEGKYGADPYLQKMIDWGEYQPNQSETIFL